MSLFDDDFYSPKVSPWQRKKLENEQWPGWRRLAGMPIQAVILSAVLGIALLVLLFSPIWVPSPDEEAGGTGIEGVYGSAQTSENIVRVVERMKPAVVSVISTFSDVGGEVEADGDVGDEYAEGTVNVGSGIIYKQDGKRVKIVTNQHVIGESQWIEVVLSNGHRQQAKLIGSDLLTDLAVLEIEADDVKDVAEFGDSEVLREGELAMAVGNPFGLGNSPTFTLGIISSLNRMIPVSLALDGHTDWEMEMLQTDAAINNGNSGGALVNLEGKVIGINSMKVAQPGVEGLGFAIPSNVAVPVIEELEMNGKIRRPYLGVATVDLEYSKKGSRFGEIPDLPDEVRAGIIVLEAFDPAAGAGIRTHDVIVALDDTPIGSTLSLRKFLYLNKKIGDRVKVTYYRGTDKQTATVKLGENPEI